MRKKTIVTSKWVLVKSMRIVRCLFLMLLAATVLSRCTLQAMSEDQIHNWVITEDEIQNVFGVGIADRGNNNYQDFCWTQIINSWDWQIDNALDQGGISLSVTRHEILSALWTLENHVRLNVHVMSFWQDPKADLVVQELRLRMPVYKGYSPSVPGITLSLDQQLVGIGDYAFLSTEQRKGGGEPLYLIEFVKGYVFADIIGWGGGDIVSQLEQLAGILASKIPPAPGTEPDEPPKPSEPPVVIELFADKQKDERGIYVYEPGERLVLFGRILKLLENGQYVEYGASKRFQIQFKFPSEKYGSYFLFSRSVWTDDDGTFRFSPFAPYSSGEYKVTAEITNERGEWPELEGYQGSPPSSTITLETHELPRVIDLGQVRQQLEEIKRIYQNEESLKHRNDVIDKWVVSERQKLSRGNRQGSLEPDPDKKNPHSWGITNNEQYGAENPFSCANYRNEVLKLLNRIRFSDDPETRALLQWIDYGPIMRGFQSDRYIWGEHHAVALYDSQSSPVIAEKERPLGYESDRILVLDPWPTQTPEVYTYEEFSSFYGLDMFPFLDLGRRRVVPDPEMKDDTIYDWQQWFPILGGVVYWNLQWTDPLGHPTLPGAPAGWGKTVKPATTTIAGQSPITFCVTNNAGERVGVLEDGSLVAEIEGSELYIYPESTTDLLWYIGLPDGNYDVRMTGLADGNFDVGITGTDRVLYYYTAPIRKNEVATLEVDTGMLGGKMTLPSGEKVSPTTIPVGDGTTTEHGELVATITLGSDLGFDNRENFVLGQTLYIRIAVTDSLTGRGIPNANLRYGLHNDRSGLFMDGGVNTDANGEYTLEIVLGEDYLGTTSFTVAADAEGFEHSVGTSREFTVDAVTDVTRTGNGTDGSFLLGLVGIVVVIVVVLCIVLVRATSRRRTPKPITAAVPAPPSGEYGYCENCGRKIPSGTLYCPNCGDKQGV